MRQMFFTTLIWFRSVYKFSSCCWFCIHFWIKWELWKTFEKKMIGWTHFSNQNVDTLWGFILLSIEGIFGKLCHLVQKMKRTDIYSKIWPYTVLNRAKDLIIVLLFELTPVVFLLIMKTHLFKLHKNYEWESV